MHNIIIDSNFSCNVRKEKEGEFAFICNDCKFFDFENNKCEKYPGIAFLSPFSRICKLFEKDDGLRCKDCIYFEVIEFFEEKEDGEKELKIEKKCKKHNKKINPYSKPCKDFLKRDDDR
jgi:hypothetical protein